MEVWHLQHFHIDHLGLTQAISYHFGSSPYSVSPHIHMSIHVLLWSWLIKFVNTGGSMRPLAVGPQRWLRPLCPFPARYNMMYEHLEAPIQKHDIRTDGHVSSILPFRCLDCQRHNGHRYWVRNMSHLLNDKFSQKINFWFRCASGLFC